MGNIKKYLKSKIHKIRKQLTPFPKLIQQPKDGKFTLTHISAFSYGNAGDTLLPVVLRDLFNENINIKKWNSIHVYDIVDERIIKRINNTNALIIGGGGLFLRDTNPNKISGWQWPCSIEDLNKITKPIILFAVGYNRFRGQIDFDPIFTDNLNNFVEKASFIGIRNQGSINKLKQYLRSEDLRNKLIFQPCMTTLISKIYPDFIPFEQKEDFIAVNCAFDRRELRSSNDDILNAIARVVSSLSKEIKIKYFSHMFSDELILPYFDKLKIEYELVKLNNVKQIVANYSLPKLVIGMRGHAQMIPFGCNTPILSIVSHDKMQWFLNDINHPEWGVDVLDENFESKLLAKAIHLYNNYQSTISSIQSEQEKLWEITCDNMNKLKRIIT